MLRVRSSESVPATGAGSHEDTLRHRRGWRRHQPRGWTAHERDQEHDDRDGEEPARVPKEAPDYLVDDRKPKGSRVECWAHE
jgi:hypothetical protein